MSIGGLNGHFYLKKNEKKWEKKSEKKLKKKLGEVATTRNVFPSKMFSINDFFLAEKSFGRIVNRPLLVFKIWYTKKILVAKKNLPKEIIKIPSAPIKFISFVFSFKFSLEFVLWFEFVI